MCKSKHGIRGPQRISRIIRDQPVYTRPGYFGNHKGRIGRVVFRRFRTR